MKKVAKIKKSSTDAVADTIISYVKVKEAEALNPREI